MLLSSIAFDNLLEQKLFEKAIQSEEISMEISEKFDNFSLFEREIEFI